MRIAVVESATHGGLLHYAVQLADGLARRGHDVAVIGSRGNELERHPGRVSMRAVLAPPTRDSSKPSSRVGYLVRRAGIAARLTRGWVRALAATRTGRYDAVV